MAVDAPIPLIDGIYALDDAEFAFFTAQTGITDPEALKKHIIDLQTKIYAVRCRR